MPEDNLQLLRDGIARNGGAVVSLPSAGGLVSHYKSRLLADDPDGFWVQCPPDARELIDEIIATGRLVGVSFKAGVNKAVFASPLLRREPALVVGARLRVEAVLVQQPDDVKLIQRRSNYRASITDDSDMSVRIWRLGRHAHLKDRPPAAQELTVRLRNLSTGGMGVTFFARDEQPPRVAPEDRLRIQLTLPGGEQLLLEGRMRHPLKPPRGALEIRAGLQFKALEDNLEGRYALATLIKVVGEMQRAEARRYRLGIA